MIEYFLKQLDNLDTTKPSALVLYFGLLCILIYQYYREGSEVFREYGRLHREIIKEQALKDLYTAEWKNKLQNATNLFNLGGWIIFASFMMLVQFVGIMILLGFSSVHQFDINQLTPRAEAQRYLGLGFIFVCIIIALLLNRSKYVALQLMYEFSSQYLVPAHSQK